jgi:acetyl esterase
MSQSTFVDEQGRAYMRALEALGPQDYRRLSVREARAVLQEHNWPLPPAARRVRLCEQRPLDAVLYSPSAPRPAGLVLYLHGGGFVMGDAASAAPLCARLAADVGCHVLALEYRLAPEARFPAAPEDCLFALRWATEHAAVGGWDPARLSVVGQSAGGNLAAVTAQAWRGCPGLRLQVLICPLTDFRPDGHASRTRLAGNSVLSADAIAWFERSYLRGPEDRLDARASPLRAADLSGLAPAHLITAAGDPLCDEGEAYARALSAAGVAVRHERYPSVHGFVELWTDLEQGERALRSVIGSLRAAL